MKYLFTSAQFEDLTGSGSGAPNTAKIYELMRGVRTGTLSVGVKSDFDPSSPFVHVRWPYAGTGLVGTLKPHIKKSSRYGSRQRIEPFDIQKKFESLGVNSSNALTLTYIAGAESGYDGRALNSDTKASGLFQGIVKHNWHPALSESLADHVPMMKDMITTYKAKSSALNFGEIYAAHFTPALAQNIKTSEAAVKAKGSNLGGQYGAKLATGEYVTAFSFSAIWNLAVTMILTENTNVVVELNLPEMMSVSVFAWNAKVGNWVLSHTEDRSDEGATYFTQGYSGSYGFKPTVGVTISSGGKDAITAKLKKVVRDSTVSPSSRRASKTVEFKREKTKNTVIKFSTTQ